MTQEETIARDMTRFREFTAAARQAMPYTDMNARCYAERLRRLGVSADSLASTAGPASTQAPTVAPLAVAEPVLAPARPVVAAGPTAQNERFAAELSNYFPHHRVSLRDGSEITGTDDKGDEVGRMAAEISAFLPRQHLEDQRAARAPSTEATDEADRLASEIASSLPVHRRA